MAVNILLITAFTESSAVCARVLPVIKAIVKTMRKYFMLIDFKILWQMNWILNALLFMDDKNKLSDYAKIQIVTNGRADDDSRTRC